MKATSARTLGISAPTSTTNGACLTPWSTSPLFAGFSCDTSVALHEPGETPRFVELAVQRDRADDVGQAADRVFRRRVLPGGHRFRVRVRREVQHVGLDAAGGLRAAGVGVDRKEQIGLLAGRDGRALVERDELVAAPRQHDVDAGRREERLEAERDVEDDVGLRDALAEGPGVVPAVSGVDDDSRGAEAELARQGDGAPRGCRGGRRRWRPVSVAVPGPRPRAEGSASRRLPAPDRGGSRGRGPSARTG